VGGGDGKEEEKVEASGEGSGCTMTEEDGGCPSFHCDLPSFC